MIKARRRQIGRAREREKEIATGFKKLKQALEFRVAVLIGNQRWLNYQSVSKPAPDCSPTRYSAFPLAGSFFNSNPYSNSLPTVYLLCSANTLSADESTTQKCWRRVIRSNFNEINPSARASCLLDKQKTNIVRRSLIPPASNAPRAAPWHIFALMSSASLRRQITGWQKRTRLLAAESNSLTRERCAHAGALPHFSDWQIKPASLLDIKSLTYVCFCWKIFSLN